MKVKTAVTWKTTPADGRIEILPGGGIDAYNLQDVLDRSGTDQIHLALLKQYTDRSTLGRPHIFYGGNLRPAEEHFDIIDGQAVSAIREACGAWTQRQAESS